MIMSSKGGRRLVKILFIRLWPCWLFLFTAYFCSYCAAADRKAHGSKDQRVKRIHIYNGSTFITEQQARIQTSRALRVLRYRVGGRWTVASYTTLEYRYKPPIEMFALLAASRPNWTVVFLDSPVFSFGVANVCAREPIAMLYLANDRTIGDAARNWVKATLAHELGHNLGMRHNNIMSLMFPFWGDFHRAGKGRWRVLANDRREVRRCERLILF